MHDEWVKHRSSERFIKNLRTSFKSGVSMALRMVRGSAAVWHHRAALRERLAFPLFRAYVCFHVLALMVCLLLPIAQELMFVIFTSIFCVIVNMLLTGYHDFSGTLHKSPFQAVALVRLIKKVALPAFPFTIAMPALSLLLVFRVNTAYARWNEARTLWGGVVNNCRNVVRQANVFFPETKQAEHLKDVLAANTAAFAKSLRNFLRGPTDDAAFRSELEELVAGRLMSQGQVEACMTARNRPIFMLNAVSTALRKADLHPIERSRIDQTVANLVELTGACERIFKSPVPLVYTRHTSRFLAFFLLCLPFGIWPVMGDSWNHWLTIPVSAVLSFFLLGIEEIGIQIEEPFSILPLEALCDGAIAATITELLQSKRDKTFDVPPKEERPAATARDIKNHELLSLLSVDPGAPVAN
jgi:predicted membrane chloride channel (bestrophin family)